jgi:hypothetical protein
MSEKVGGYLDATVKRSKGLTLFLCVVCLKSL